MRVRVRWSRACLLAVAVAGSLLALRSAPDLLAPPEPPAIPVDVGLLRIAPEASVARGAAARDVPTVESRQRTVPQRQAKPKPKRSRRSAPPKHPKSKPRPRRQQKAPASPPPIPETPPEPIP